jgi:tetratricopeptide (TPR) repeat protein
MSRIDRAGPVQRADPSERAALEEELAYLRRSLEDLEREREAGDVDGHDYARLVAQYRGRVAHVERELAALPPGGVAPSDGASSARPTGSSTLRGRPPARRPTGVLASRRARLLSGWGAFGCLLAAAVVLVLAAAQLGPFAPAPPLSKTARIQVMLAEADILGSNGDVTQALATYDRVLALDPTQPEALANGGWLARVAGLSQHDAALVRNGDAEIEAAVRSDPGYALAHAYDGVLLLEDRHEPLLAARQFEAMLRDHPSSTLLRSVRASASATFAALRRPLPPAFGPASGSSGS